MIERNVITYWGEQKNPMHDSEPEQHLKSSLHHSFNMFVVTNFSSNKKTQKILKQFVLLKIK